VNETEVAKLLVKLLKATRMERLESGKRRPVGVIVNCRISLTGFTWRKVDVRWTLRRTSGGLLPHAWLRGQRAALLRGEAEKDSASPSFWFRFRCSTGRSIRLTVRNENGVPLDRADSRRFG
jgi:hypothetical protein